MDTITYVIHAMATSATTTMDVVVMVPVGMYPCSSSVRDGLRRSHYSGCTTGTFVVGVVIELFVTVTTTTTITSTAVRMVIVPCLTCAVMWCYVVAVVYVLIVFP